jgi:hypothetical protein
MTLCDLFNQFFDTLFQEANFSEIDRHQMKTSLTLIWLKRTSEKISPLLGQEDLSLFENLLDKTDTNPADPNLAQKMTLFLQDAARNQQVVNIFVTEAEQLMTHIAGVFKEHASPEQLQTAREQLAKLSPNLSSEN